jgi:hypothetical protein
LVLIDDFCSCNDELAEEINELKSATFECVREVWACSRDLGEYVLNGKRLEDLPTGERASLKGTLLLAWTAVFEVNHNTVFLFLVRKSDLNIRQIIFYN